MPALSLPKVGGGEISLGGANEKWRMLVVYRGKHCPLCRIYLKTLNGMLDQFGGLNTEVVAVSADPKEKAESETKEEGWRFPVGYGLTPEQMLRLGLYVSNPRSAQETDRPFAEPGLFVVNPEGKAHIVDISNAPFARPDLKVIANGLKYIQENAYPIRGTAT
jgi:peroxiredoxin